MKSLEQYFPAVAQGELSNFESADEIFKGGQSKERY